MGYLKRAQNAIFTECREGLSSLSEAYEKALQLESPVARYKEIEILKMRAIGFDGKVDDAIAERENSQIRNIVMTVVGLSAAAGIVFGVMSGGVFWGPLVLGIGGGVLGFGGGMLLSLVPVSISSGLAQGKVDGFHGKVQDFADKMDTALDLIATQEPEALMKSDVADSIPQSSGRGKRLREAWLKAERDNEEMAEKLGHVLKDIKAVNPEAGQKIGETLRSNPAAFRDLKRMASM